MSELLAPADVERFRGIIARRVGLHFDDDRLVFLAGVLERRLSEGRGPSGLYLDQVDGRPASDELRALVPELTVGETYFFRHAEQFRAFAELALPERLAAGDATRPLRILSAGCASGEEAYSLAISVREHVLTPGRRVMIRAVDLNAALLGRAQLAHYSAWALRETPAASQRRWFAPVGRDFALDASVREAVSFEEKNLVADDLDLWPLDSYDVVFCRNVLMYLTPESAQGVVARLTGALAPGGYLFLGHAETLRGLSHDFHLCHTHGAFYYQRKDGRPEAELLPPAAEPPPSRPVSSDPYWAATWLETIQRTATRIQALADKPSASETGRRLPTAPRRDLDVGLALELLQRERFTEALELLGALPSEAASDPNVLLLRAALLTHSGQIAAAEKLCAQLLARDELNAGAHYLLALCREGLGDRLGAAEHDQIAVYLDSAFAMPRLHLGLMARRAGDRAVAQRELEQATLLLQREDASRLLLFGGGFSREALVALCRAELSAVEDRS